MRTLVLTLLAAAIPTIASAADLTLEPGKWEFTTTVETPMAPQPKVTKKTRCVSEADNDPLAAMTADSKCRITDKTADGTTLTWKVACAAHPGSPQMTGDGRLTTDGSTAEGRMTARVEVMGQTMEMTTSWKGKRLGDC